MYMYVISTDISLFCSNCKTAPVVASKDGKSLFPPKTSNGFVSSFLFLQYYYTCALMQSW